METGDSLGDPVLPLNVVGAEVFSPNVPVGEVVPSTCVGKVVPSTDVGDGVPAEGLPVPLGVPAEGTSVP